eukprot:scaffold7601_cov417-Prasinococcus_capsulatus_cf.AAC.6
MAYLGEQRTGPGAIFAYKDTKRAYRHISAREDVYTMNMYEQVSKFPATVNHHASKNFYVACSEAGVDHNMLSCTRTSRYSQHRQTHSKNAILHPQSIAL